MEVYQPMIAWGAAAPAAPGQWTLALERLVEDAGLRRALTSSADRLLEACFAWERLEDSLQGLLARAATPRRAA